MKYKKILWVCLMIILVHSTWAIQPVPASFYGYATTPQGYAPSGTLIEAYDSRGVLCGSFIIQQEGGYGLLLCNGDDPTTAYFEGAVNEDTISFYINGFETQTRENITWHSGVLQQVDLFLGNVTKIKLVMESPVKTSVLDVKESLIKIISLVGSIVMIIIFLWIYNKK